MTQDVAALWQEYIGCDSVTATDVSYFAFAPEPLGQLAWDYFFSCDPNEEALESLVTETPDDVTQQERVIDAILSHTSLSFRVCVKIMVCFEAHREQVWELMKSMNYSYDDVVHMIRETRGVWAPAVDLFLSLDPKPEHLHILLRATNLYDLPVWKQMIAHSDMSALHARSVLDTVDSLRRVAADWIMEHVNGRVLCEHDVAALFGVMVCFADHADEAWHKIAACDYSLIDAQASVVFIALSEDRQLIVWNHLHSSEPSEEFCMKVVHHAVSDVLKESAVKLIAPRLMNRVNMMHVIQAYPDVAMSVASRLFVLFDGKLADRHLARLRNHVPDLVRAYEKRRRLLEDPRNIDAVWSDLEAWVDAQGE